mmetsp:Transcript_148113/g.369262  ORF Transcript_148113/g.369262 Transcript_148113/m.369262 type:complete len:754 (+) Transcript_148113:197-2458(+)
MPLALGLSRSKLLQKCIQVIDTFDPKKTTVDAYVEDAEILKDKSVGEIELKFIHQVFYGCIRYQKFLKLFVTSFLYKCPTVAVRSEQTLYMILGYLMFFRLEELGVAEFRGLCNCGLGTATALFALLQYSLDVGELEKWVKVEWCKVYDTRYVEEEIIGKLQTFAPELRPVVDEFEFKATGTVKASDTTVVQQREKRLTSPKPFNITQPRPRLVPEPEPISREVKAMPIPPTLHATSLAEVEEQKKKRLEEERAKVATKYKPEQQFDLTTKNRRDGSELEELQRKVEADRMAECTFKPKTKKYAPPTEDAIVRQNVAAVLREDALLKQKQAKEYQILKRYEEDLHDASEFHRWQEQMKEKDHVEEEKRMHHRMVEMQLAREGAIEAFEDQQRKKGLMAAIQREELKTDLEQKQIEYEEELQDKKVLVKETIEEREKTRLAEQKELQARADHAEQIRREKEAEAERKRREDEQEMERRKELIRQIRALEKVPVERFKQFDPAEAPCQGLLEEMSHAELWERLKIAQAQHAQELDDKRERQLGKKLEKQQEIMEKAETLAKIRERARDESRARHDAMRKKKQDDEEAQQRYREQCIEEVAAKIQSKKMQKRQEELRLRKELKEISMKRQFLAANAEMVEAKAHAEQHAGLDREAKDRQKGILTDQRRRNEIKTREATIRRTNRQNAQDEFKAMQENVNERLRRAKAADTALKDEILRANATARNSQKTLEKKLQAEFGHSSSKYSGGPTRMAVSA